MHFYSLFQLATGLAALSSAAMAHPVGEEHVHPNDLGRRELEATTRHVATGKCAREIARYNSARRLKRRMLAARSLNPRDEPGSNSDVLIPGKDYQIPEEENPTYKSIQNNTCVLAPEITEGPYFVRNELLRSDIREDQPGVDLELDIGVMDIRTCKPIPKALVQIWSCNATGFYSSFTTAPALDPIVLPASTDPVFTNSASISRLIELGGENLAVNKTDEMTWLRGAYPTNDDGVVEFKTKYPGFYTGRAIHIHTMVSTNWTHLSNGTVISNSGNVHHIGQIFFEEELNDMVLATAAYQNSTHTRLPNYRDAILPLEHADGYDAFADHVLLGDAITDGVLGYITIGVDTAFQASIFTNNTWAPTSSYGYAPPKATSTNKPVF